MQTPNNIIIPFELFLAINYFIDIFDVDRLDDKDKAFLDYTKSGIGNKKKSIMCRAAYQEFKQTKDVNTRMELLDNYHDIKSGKN